MHLAYTYDNANRRTGLTLPDGKSESWGYDPAGRVNSLTQAGSTPNTYTMSHNGAGDIATLPAPNGGEQTWSYDGAGRITGTTTLFTQTVTLDGAGQRTANNDSWSSTGFGYDPAGRYGAGGNRAVFTMRRPFCGPRACKRDRLPYTDKHDDHPHCRVKEGTGEYPGRRLRFSLEGRH